ncbi:MAG TPA: PilZ domain-containing protein [Vicinamibacteria bacterium]|nr:PilZ domain-containing protein [Vicinamibacteria bacterium]
MPRRPPNRKDKRRTSRIEPYLAPCRIVVGRRRIAGYVTNLSPRGARVYCDERPPRVGERVVLEIRFRERSAPTRILAEARWMKAALDPTEVHSFGASFRGISASQLRAVEEVLQEFRRRAAALLGVAR